MTLTEYKNQGDKPKRMPFVIVEESEFRYFRPSKSGASVGLELWGKLYEYHVPVGRACLETTNYKGDSSKGAAGRSSCFHLERPYSPADYLDRKGKRIK